MIESPHRNSVASFRKSIVDRLKFEGLFFNPEFNPQGAFDSLMTPRTLHERGIRIRFSRKPHPIGFSENFCDERQFLSDDENLQYDAVVYVDYLKEG